MEKEEKRKEGKARTGHKQSFFFFFFFFALNPLRKDRSTCKSKKTF